MVAEVVAEIGALGPALQRVVEAVVAQSVEKLRSKLVELERMVLTLQARIQTLEGHAPGAAAACMDAGQIARQMAQDIRGGGGYSGGPPVSSAAWVRGQGEDSRERPPESHRSQLPVKPPPPSIIVKENAANPAVRPPPDGCQQDDNKPRPRPKKAPPPLPGAAWTEQSGSSGG